MRCRTYQEVWRQVFCVVSLSGEEFTCVLPKKTAIADTERHIPDPTSSNINSGPDFHTAKDRNCESSSLSRQRSGSIRVANCRTFPSASHSEAYYSMRPCNRRGAECFMRRGPSQLALLLPCVRAAGSGARYQLPQLSTATTFATATPTPDIPESWPRSPSSGRIICASWIILKAFER